jgi:putative chromate ion transporter
MSEALSENGSAKILPADSVRGSPLEVFLVFLKLGLTTFGGPIAHLGFFQREIIDRRKWITDSAYGDLVALCQFLPGPASSQVAISLGYLRAGIRGAFAASIGFVSPSAILMIAIGYGFQTINPQSGFLHGLKLAAVPVVAQAVWSMGGKFCPDRVRLTLAIVAACVVLGFSTAWVQVAVIAAGALFGRIFFRERSESDKTKFAKKKSSWRLVCPVEYRPVLDSPDPPAHSLCVVAESLASPGRCLLPVRGTCFRRRPRCIALGAV